MLDRALLLPICVGVAVLLSAMHVPLLAAQKTASGHMAFANAAVVFLQELIKLLACAIVVLGMWLSGRFMEASVLRWREVCIASHRG